MQPTRKQVLEWAREAGFPCIKGEPIIACGRDNLSRFASIVRSAALDEAAAVNKAKADQMERKAQAAHDNGEHDEVSSLRSTAWILSVCKADIEQLKGKQ